MIGEKKKIKSYNTMFKNEIRNPSYSFHPRNNVEESVHRIKSDKLWKLRFSFRKSRQKKFMKTLGYLWINSRLRLNPSLSVFRFHKMVFFVRTLISKVNYDDINGLKVWILLLVWFLKRLLNGWMREWLKVH